MKKIRFTTLIAFALLIACTPAPTTTPLPTATTAAVLPTATVLPANTPTPTLTATPTMTFVPSPTATLTRTPEPTTTQTKIPEVLPLALSLSRSIDLSEIPQNLLGKTNVWIYVGPNVFSNAGVVGERTIMEILPTYPGFDGAVMHVNVLSPSPMDSMQRAYIAIESTVTSTGQWAAEISHLVLQAPRFLVNSGWHKDPMLQLISVGWHPDNNRRIFRMVGGVRLLTNDGINYYVTVYRVNKDAGVTNTQYKIPFKLGQKQIIRPELFYKGDVPYFRAFLRDSQPNSSNLFIGEIQLDPNINEPIQGDITWVGVYSGQYVTGFEGISGEVKIFK